MNFQARFERLASRFLPEVLRFLARLVHESTPADSTLEAMCVYHLETGGKRLRAMIPLLVAETFGLDPARLVPFAAACEMLHNATLVHDDLQDGDAFRRGKETIWRRFGVSQAINLGDAMYYYAVLAFQALDFPPEVTRRVLERLLRETIQVIDGQEREFALKREPAPSVRAYLAMVEGKTSGLFRLPLAGTADLCGADAPAVEAIAEAAAHLGILFQIQDDVLDLYGNKGRGERGGDVAEGKRSYLAVHALANLDASRRSRLLENLDLERARTTPEHVDEVLELFHACDALGAAREEIMRRQRLARESVIGRAPEVAPLVAGLAARFLAPVEHVLTSVDSRV